MCALGHIAVRAAMARAPYLCALAPPFRLGARSRVTTDSGERRVFLGIDIGTSSVKALLVDGEQRIIASHDVALSVQRPHPGFSEQAPDAWVDAVIAAVDALKAAHPGTISAVEGIGLSGQMHGAVRLGTDHKSLRPAILWNDSRSSAECAELEARWPELRAVTGNKAMPGFTAPKLLWVAHHEPEIFARTVLVVLPKAYIRLVLS